MIDTESPDWILADSSEVFMDGRATYYLRDPGRPGIKASLRLHPEERDALRRALALCLHYGRLQGGFEAARLFGWEPFGTYADDPAPLEFAGEGEDGFPLFERRINP